MCSGRYTAPPPGRLRPGVVSRSTPDAPLLGHMVLLSGVPAGVSGQCDMKPQVGTHDRCCVCEFLLPVLTAFGVRSFVYVIVNMLWNIYRTRREY
jgi:hypothetical protein